MIGSYFCIVAIMLVVLGIILGVYQKYYARDSKNFNEYIFHNIAVSANNVVRDMNNLKINLQRDEKLGEFLKEQKADIFLSESTYDIIRDFKGYKYFNSNINLFFLYLPDIDSVLYEGGVTRSRFFYDMWFRGGDASYEEWKRGLDSGVMEEYCLFDGKGDDGKDIEYLSLIFRMAVEGRAIGVIMSDKRNMMSGLEKIKWQKACNIYIFNPYGHLVVSNVSDTDALPKSMADILKNRDDSVEIFQSECVIANNKWQTVVTIQKDELDYGMRMIKNVIALVLICSAVLLFFIIIYVIRQNYRPAQRLFALLDITKNEQQMDVAYRKIQEILNKNEYLSENIQKKEEGLVDSYLTSLLKGGYFNQEISFRFSGDYFAVLIFEIRDIACFFSDTTLSENEKNYHLSFIIENVISEKLQAKKIRGYFLTLEERLVCVANCELPIDLNEIRKTVSEGVCFINENFEIQLFYSVSLPCCGTDKLTAAFRQAGDAMDYICFYETFESTSFQEFIDKISSEDVLSLKETVFSNFIKSGYQEKACEAIKGIFRHISESRAMSIDQVRFIAMQIISIVENISRSYLAEEKLLSGETVIYREIKNINTLSGICDCLLSYIRRVCEEIDMQLAGNKRFIRMSDVLEHVRENFMDPNFNINAAALHFHVTPSYLSKSFRKQTGVPMLDYINILRIERVNDLTHQGQYSFEEILQMAGFGNERTYFRVKKKVKEMDTAEFHRKTSGTFDVEKKK